MTEPQSPRLVGLLLAIQLISFWPVWQWYLARLTDSSDEPWGVVALATAGVFVARQTDARPSAQSRPLALLGASALVCVYTLGFTLLPPLVRAILAVLALSCTVSVYYLGRSVHLGILGLLLLSLPVIASLQFYLGYPVRVLTAEIAAQLISLTGYSVTAVGNCFHWAGEVIAVDAPCSGVKMLWAGLYVNFTLACFGQLNTRQTWLSYSFSTATIFLGNLLRTTMLFYGEAGIFQLPSGAHQAIGLFAFGGVVVVILAFHQRLKREAICV